MKAQYKEKYFGPHKRLKFLNAPFCAALAAVALLSFLICFFPIGKTRAAPLNEYTIDVTNVSSAPDKGYTYNSGTRKLTFTAGASGNSYTIIRSGPSIGLVSGIEFVAGGSPASVSMNNLLNLTGGITFPAGFQADLSFNNVELTAYGDVNTGPTLALPAGYRGTLNIHGLTVTALTFPSDYDLPITFNGLTVSKTLTYPTNYSEPITIGGSFNVKGSQFPSGYTGSITIGDTDGTFDILNTICRPGASIGFDAGIFLPNNISTLTINNAKTGVGGHLNIKLGSADNFKLLLAGSSDINGYIEVPTNAALTIDSKDAPGSESGRLAISASGTNACIGTNNNADTGQITINGGTVEATQTNYTANAPAAIGGGANHAGHITINGGKVIAKGNENGAAIGGGAGMYGIGYVTINGGNVTARCVGREIYGTSINGAAIGGGSNATGGFSTNGTLYGPYAPEVAGAHVLITGGTVLAESGDMERNHLGSSSSFGAAIGSGKLGHANVTITGGHVTANSAHGACIGNGSGDDTINNNLSLTVLRGKVTITGGAVIRGYSLVGANIGMGHFCKYAPAYHIDKEADILMYSRSNYDGLHGVTGYRDGTGRDNRGDGYFVSMYLDLWCNEIIRGNVVAYNMTDPYAPVKYLPIQVEDNYTSVLFSTGRDYPEDFQVFVEFYDYNHVYKGLRQFVHYYDHLLPLPGGGPSALQLKNPIIPSVTHMYGYPHNFNTTFHHALMVHLDYGANAPVYYRVIEKYVDANGNPIRNDSGFGSKESSIRQGLNYNGVHEEITDYIYKGYKLDNPPNSSSDYTAGEPIVQDVNGDIIVYFVYAREYTVTEKYVDKNGNPLVPPVADTTVTIQSATPVYTKTIPEQNGYKVLGYFIGDPFIGEYTQDAAVTDHPLSDDMIIYFVYQKTTTLTVSKEVAGDYANRGKVFNFTVYFEDSGGKAPVPGTNFYYIKETGGNTAENGTLTVVDGGIADFSLAHGQKIIISGVDADGRMRIAEDEYPYYDASFADSELGYEEGGDTGPQMRDMTPDRVFDFTNERVEVPETGLDTGRLGAGFILPVSALSASLIFLAAKAILRRRGRKSRFFEK